MQMQFHKTQLPCLQQVKWEVQNQEQTQEVRLDDSLPDIGRVLGAWGQVLLRGKEWRSGSIHVSGGVMVWVLYAPEDGGACKSLETWLPFQMKWDIPQTDRDGTILAACLLRSVDARSISARKLMVRTNVGVLAQALAPVQVDVYSPPELPEDVQLMKRTYPLRLPQEAGEKPFFIEEDLSMPGSCPALARLVRYELRPELVDQKVMADKVVFRGNGILHILYEAVDGQLYGWDFEIPFSQYGELDKTYEQEATAHITPALTSMELEQTEDGRLHLKAGLTGQYMICDRQMLETVEDAYSPHREVALTMDMLQLPSVLETTSQTLHAEQTVEAEGIRAVDTAFYPEHPRALRDPDGVDMELNGQFLMLYCDPEGNLCSAAPRWSDNWKLEADENSQVQMQLRVSGMPQGSLGGGTAALRSDLLAETMTMAGQGIPVVSALELSELASPDRDRPSLILRTIGQDSLWEVAKATGSTVDAIRKANQLTEEPVADQMLLIPVL